MICVTGASGYLGQHILQMEHCIAVPRDGYDRAAGQVVIHCAATVPHTEADAYDSSAAHINLRLLDNILAVRPLFLVFVSTRETVGTYALTKRQAEARCQESGIPTHVIRFPGLFGPPRTHGLAYNALRTILAGRAFQASRPLPDWTCMPVRQAAQMCLDVAHAGQPGLTVARNADIEAFLSWVRA